MKNGKMDDAAGAVPALTEWMRPTLTKLSLDETLAGGGSMIDGGIGTSQPGPVASPSPTPL